MDEFQSVQATPQVQFNQNPFFSGFFGNTLKILIPVILVVGVGFLAANYLKTPQNTKATSISFVAPRAGQIPEKLSLPCPVPSQFCSQGKITTYEKNPALIFNLPSGTDILAINSVQSSADMAVLENHNTKVKILYLAAQDKEGCYTITYTIPASADFTKPSSYPIKLQTSISKASNDSLPSDTEKGNLIVMIRKNPVPDTNLCVMQDNPLREYGPFQAADKYISGLK
ncbi:MAG: hypothetical protein Q7R49_06995 [Candidatus Daviesbacteria bacterium]|nr:hypothetical protein [Candidatus Daviesbacteria bacterium]